MAGLLDGYAAGGPGLLDGFGGSNGLMMAGASLLSGGGLGGAAQGLMQGMQVERAQRLKDLQQRAVMQAVVGAGGSPAHAIAAASDPALAKLFFERRGWPEFKPHNVADVGTSFDPSTGKMTPQFAPPQVKTVGNDVVQVTPNVPGLMSPQPMSGGAPPVMTPPPSQGVQPPAAPVGGPQSQVLFQGGPKPDDVAGFRKELAANPAVKRYQEAAPIYNSMVKSFGSNTRASDLDFVYGMAKIFDPDSVVREGEMIIVNQAQSLPASIVGAINRLNGGEALQPQTRHDLLSVSKTRMDSYAEQANAVVESGRGIAGRSRMNAADVLPQMTPLAPVPARPAAAPTIQIQEGMTATDPATGRRIIFRNGQWAPLP